MSGYNQEVGGGNGAVREGNWFEELALKDVTGVRFYPNPKGKNRYHSFPIPYIPYNYLLLIDTFHVLMSSFECYHSQFLIDNKSMHHTYGPNFSQRLHLHHECGHPKPL